MAIHVSPASVPVAAGCPVVGFELDLCADADRIASAYEVRELAMDGLAVVLRVLDAAGTWLRVQVCDDHHATWTACA